MENVKYLMLAIMLFLNLNLKSQNYFNVMPDLPFLGVGSAARFVVPRENDFLVFGDLDTVSGYEALFISRFDYSGNLLEARKTNFKFISDYVSVDNLNKQFIKLNDSIIVFMCNTFTGDMSSEVVAYNFNQNSFKILSHTGRLLDSNITSYLMDAENGQIAVVEGLTVNARVFGNGLTKGFANFRVLDNQNEKYETIEVVDSVLGSDIRHFDILPDSSFVISGIISSTLHDNNIFQTHIDKKGLVLSHKEYPVKNTALYWEEMTTNGDNHLVFLKQDSTGVPHCSQLNAVSINTLSDDLKNVIHESCITHNTADILPDNINKLCSSSDNKGLLVVGNAKDQDNPFAFLHRSSNEGTVEWMRSYYPSKKFGSHFKSTKIDNIIATGRGSYILSGSVYDKIELRNKMWIMQVDEFGCLEKDCNLVQNSNIEHLGQIKILPNPSSGDIEIQFLIDNRNAKNIQILNAQGHTIYNKNIGQNLDSKLILDGHIFTPGLYVLLVMDKDGVLISKEKIIRVGNR